MAASVITRDTWTNDTGTAAAPNGDGTILNNAVLQNHIYARIDEMFAGAGLYATFTFGGLLKAEGLGTHAFSAGGSGFNLFSLRNTSAGVANGVQVALGNDATAQAGTLSAFSSTWTTSVYNVQDSVALMSFRAGGLSIGTDHASGDVRIYSGAGTLNLTIDENKLWTVADGVTMAVGSTNGLKIGTATTQRIGFWNHAPAAQPAAVTDPGAYTGVSGSYNQTEIDDRFTPLYTAVTTLISRLQGVGILG